jgi:alkylation response protein AidB-like acyl-CoA dehydrogenase
MDIYGLAIDPKFGGMGVPVSVGLLAFEQLCRACVSTSTQIGFFSSIADMIERFCEPEIQNKYIPMIKRGEISGSMCMTEPDSGSDVGSLRTSAEKQPDGTYLLNGTKCFITNGGGGLAFILARVKGAPKGLEGISMFFAEEWIETPQSEKKHNYRIAKIEEKMGMHGSITCEVVYENTVARLVGRENEGFKMMLHLMNEARISVGMQGLGGIEASLDMARSYAETRKQFGKPIIELPLLRRNILDWETERDAFRALMVDTVSHFDIFQRLHLKKSHTGELNQKETELYSKSTRVVRRRTPLVKYYGAEANALISQRAIQTFGGYGFMNEYGVERLHRDSFGALLYEGTSQIQALMAMKDFVKAMMKDPAKFIQTLVASHPFGSIMNESEYERSVINVSYEFRKNVTALIMRCFKPELSLSERGLRDTLAQINQVFKRDYWQEAGRFDKLMVHAETLCQALAYRETLQVLAKHATQDEKRGDLYYRYLKLVTPRLVGIYSDWKV